MDAFHEDEDSHMEIHAMDRMEIWNVWKNGPYGNMDRMEIWAVWKYGPYGNMGRMESMAWTVWKYRTHVISMAWPYGVLVLVKRVA